MVFHYELSSASLDAKAQTPFFVPAPGRGNPVSNFYDFLTERFFSPSPAKALWAGEVRTSRPATCVKNDGQFTFRPWLLDPVLADREQSSAKAAERLAA
jgi:hypothetical protein